ncbi:LAMI_0B00540g1_1 [Lachancea mirantina]|uniref:LAMI_0B00540g1_1 n=1 Tax=Lachancea mirantina TaxID=1230905 RepID=A0A1G4IT52_9SACH|nr:LAMI_0B00540g1_1 [Lachancea mirantina]
MWIQGLSALAALNFFSNGALATPVATGESSLEQLLESSYKYNDGSVVEMFVDELKALTSTNSSSCSQCVTRLSIGKSLALLRPDLVPEVYTRWCKETKFMSNTSCVSTYSRNTVSTSQTGTNFADMLTLIDPFNYDGQLYCHYKESACPKPSTPNVTLSNMWSPKQPKHYVAPEPSVNDTFKVLHISDFHIELDYTVGQEANCSTSMCCTPHSVNTKTKKNETSLPWNSFYESKYDENNTLIQGSYVDAFGNSSIWAPATTFGNYECDAPEILINSSLNSIVDFTKENNISFDFAIFTGDLVDHDEIKYTGYQMTVDSEVAVFRDIKDRLESIPVYSVLGNHDTFPYGELAPEGMGFSNYFNWNAELMADMWEDFGWLDAKSSQYARKHYTGFSVETKLGLKIISLNSNVWYKKNHYAYFNASQPDNFGQFEFLIDELNESESNDQRVWIITHIPFNGDSLPVPSKLFAEIVARFSPYTIAGIFFGHTHLDQFQILYASSGNDAKQIENVVNFGWTSQAVTPWVENNPSWRYYTVDRKTFSIMDSFNYYTKLNETFTNNGAEPKWEFEYSARDGYNISWPATSPLNGSYWHEVAQKVNQSKEYNQIYENYAKRFSPYVPDCINTSDCDEDYCFLTSFTVDSYDSCIASLPKH